MAVKTYSTRQDEAQVRQKHRKDRNAKEQITKLDNQLGKNVGAKKERARLTQEIQGGSITKNKKEE